MKYLDFVIILIPILLAVITFVFYMPLCIKSFEIEQSVTYKSISKNKFKILVFLICISIGLSFLLLIHKEDLFYYFSSWFGQLIIVYVFFKKLDIRYYVLEKFIKGENLEFNFTENNLINKNDFENIKSTIIEEIVKIKNPYIRSDRNISKLNFEEICDEFDIDKNCKVVIKDKISGVETPEKIVFNGINHKGFEKEPVVYFFIKYFNIVDSYKNGKIKYINNSQKDVLEFINDNIYFENSQAKDRFKKELIDTDFSKYVKKYFESLGK